MSPETRGRVDGEDVPLSLGVRWESAGPRTDVIWLVFKQEHFGQPTSKGKHRRSFSVTLFL